MMSLQLARNLLCQKSISEHSTSDGCQPKSQLLIQPANNVTLMDVNRHKTQRKKKKAGHVHAEDLSYYFQEHGVFVWYVMTSKVFSKSFSKKHFFKYFSKFKRTPKEWDSNMSSMESCDWFACSTLKHLSSDTCNLLCAYCLYNVTMCWGGKSAVQISLNIHPCSRLHMTPMQEMFI